MPSFLIRNLDSQLRRSLEEDALEAELPIQEVVRKILCAHYGLKCKPGRGWKREEAWEGATTILLRNMDQGLFDSLKRDSKRSGESMQRCVHQALDAHYSVVT